MSKLVDKLTTEEMINEVKKFDELWNPTLETYQNKILRTKAWRNIMTQLIPQLQTMSTAEQAEIENAIRKRWKGIRTCYSRELLKQKTNDPSLRGRKQYQYFDQLRFLDVAPRNETVNEEEFESRAPSPKPVNVPVPVKRTTHFKRKAEKVSNEKGTKKQAVQYRNLELEHEADRMFLLSLVPDLQKVPPGIKLQLKSDILNSILRAQQQDPLGASQLYVTESDENLSSNLKITGGKLYNSVMFPKHMKDVQRDVQEDEIYLSPSTPGTEFIKMEVAESLSSLEDKGSLDGSEDCEYFQD